MDCRLDGSFTQVLKGRILLSPVIFTFIFLTSIFAVFVSAAFSLVFATFYF